jgi:hypothetical protein
MTDERYQSYKKVIAILEKLGPAKLQADEEETLRDLAEGLLLAVDEEKARGMILEARDQIDLLVQSGRWLPGGAADLLENIESCWSEAISA